MLSSKRVMDLWFRSHRHVTAEMTELYSMGRLSGSALEQFEEHLLTCEHCQDRLALEDAFIQGIRDAGRAYQQQPAPRRWTLALWPKPAWALGAAALALAIFAGTQWTSRRATSARPAIVLLEAMRGNTNASVTVGQPLTLDFDLTGLPQLSTYSVQVVDATGRSEYQSTAVPRNNKLEAILSKGLPAGDYFARVNTASGELLREYALTVHR